MDKGIGEILYCPKFDLKIEEEVDFCLVLNVKGKLVGITTCGDSKKLLEEDFCHFDKCDLCFCASRLKGETIKFVIDKSKGGYVIYKQISISCGLKLSLESRYEFVNDYMSEILLMELKNFLEFKDCYLS